MNVNVRTLWTNSCLPAKVFPVVMAGVVLFNLWMGVFGEAVKNTIVAIIGTGALWLLCSSGMELLAYMVLAVPVIFIIFLLALIVFDKTLLQVTHSYTNNGTGSCCGDDNDDCDSCSGASTSYPTRDGSCSSC